jgi:hypothetical protein
MDCAFSGSVTEFRHHVKSAKQANGKVVEGKKANSFKARNLEFLIGQLASYRRKHGEL